MSQDVGEPIDVDDTVKDQYRSFHVLGDESDASGRWVRVNGEIYESLPLLHSATDLSDAKDADTARVPASPTDSPSGTKLSLLEYLDKLRGGGLSRGQRRAASEAVAATSSSGWGDTLSRVPRGVRELWAPNPAYERNPRSPAASNTPHGLPRHPNIASIEHIVEGRSRCYVLQKSLKHQPISLRSGTLHNVRAMSMQIMLGSAVFRQFQDDDRAGVGGADTKGKGFGTLGDDMVDAGRAASPGDGADESGPILRPYDLSLEGWLRFDRGIFSEETAKLFVAYQILSALAFAHERGVYHGSMSPSVVSTSSYLWTKITGFQFPTAAMAPRDATPPPMNPATPLRTPKRKSAVIATAESRIRRGSVDGKELPKPPPSPPPLPPAPKTDKYVCGSTAIRTYADTPMQRWLDGKMSNFDYLMELNRLAGRKADTGGSYHPVLPWVSDFSADARQPGAGRSHWRDLAKTKFRMNKGDPQLDRTFLTSSEDSPSHHITESLSDVTYFVYMARQTSVAILKRVVRSHFEPNEYPVSMERMYTWTPDECIPEFFTDPSVLVSRHKDKGLDDIVLPSFCATPAEFIQYHRDILESEEVSKNLHHWIDLTFGYKLSGQAAVKARNVPLKAPRYYWLPVADGGRPHGFVQLFNHPHPPRRSRSASAYNARVLRSNPLQPVDDLRDTARFARHYMSLYPAFKPHRPRGLPPSDARPSAGTNSERQASARDCFASACVIASLFLERPLFNSLTLARLQAAAAGQAKDDSKPQGVEPVHGALCHWDTLPLAIRGLCRTLVAQALPDVAGVAAHESAGGDPRRALSSIMRSDLFPHRERLEKAHRIAAYIESERPGLVSAERQLWSIRSVAQRLRRKENQSINGEWVYPLAPYILQLCFVSLPAENPNSSVLATLAREAATLLSDLVTRLTPDLNKRYILPYIRKTVSRARGYISLLLGNGGRRRRSAVTRGHGNAEARMDWLLAAKLLSLDFCRVFFRILPAGVLARSYIPLVVDAALLTGPDQRGPAGAAARAILGEIALSGGASIAHSQLLCRCVLGPILQKLADPWAVSVTDTLSELCSRLDNGTFLMTVLRRTLQLYVRGGALPAAGLGLNTDALRRGSTARTPQLRARALNREMEASIRLLSRLVLLLPEYTCDSLLLGRVALVRILVSPPRGDLPYDVAQCLAMLIVRVAYRFVAADRRKRENAAKTPTETKSKKKQHMFKAITQLHIIKSLKKNFKGITSGERPSSESVSAPAQTAERILETKLLPQLSRYIHGLMKSAERDDASETPRSPSPSHRATLPYTPDQCVLLVHMLYSPLKRLLGKSAMNKRIVRCSDVEAAVARRNARKIADVVADPILMSYLAWTGDADSLSSSGGSNGGGMRGFSRSNRANTLSFSALSVPNLLTQPQRDGATVAGGSMGTVAEIKPGSRRSSVTQADAKQPAASEAGSDPLQTLASPAPLGSRRRVSILGRKTEQLKTGAEEGAKTPDGSAESRAGGDDWKARLDRYSHHANLSSILGVGSAHAWVEPVARGATGSGNRTFKAAVAAEAAVSSGYIRHLAAHEYHGMFLSASSAATQRKRSFVHLWGLHLPGGLAHNPLIHVGHHGQLHGAAFLRDRFEGLAASCDSFEARVWSLEEAASLADARYTDVAERSTGAVCAAELEWEVPQPAISDTTFYQTAAGANATLTAFEYWCSHSSIVVGSAHTRAAVRPRLSMFDLRTARSGLAWRVEPSESGGVVSAVRVGPDGTHWLAAGTTDGAMLLLDDRSGVCLARWKAHSSAINFIEPSVDAALVTASADRSVAVWSLHNAPNSGDTRLASKLRHRYAGLPGPAVPCCVDDSLMMLQGHKISAVSLSAPPAKGLQFSSIKSEKTRHSVKANILSFLLLSDYHVAVMGTDDGRLLFAS